jgi:hypothetical protein
MNEDFYFQGPITYEVRDSSIEIGRQRWGFAEISGVAPDGSYHQYTVVCAGPIGEHRVPVSAAAGWGIVVAVALLLAAIIGTTTLLHFRREAASRQPATATRG